jgi:DNA-binding IclR family transcriptional regulator
MVKSAERAIQILEAVGSSREGLTHGGLTSGLNIPKSSLSSLLANLVQRGYLILKPYARGYTYVLGPQVLVLAGRYLDRLDIVSIGQPIIKKITTQMDESSEIAVKQGHNIMIVCKEDCSLPLKAVIELGNPAPIYATAAGKAILAHLSEDEIERYFLEVQLKSETPHTITDPRVLREELEKIRAGAIAYSREELNEGIVAMAAPVFNFEGRVHGSIVVPVPTNRFTQEKESETAQILRKAAAEVSYQLGFRLPSIVKA